MNILYLEDRGATAYMVNQLFNANGHLTFWASNIPDAQNFWEHRQHIPIHCILLDLQLPMDGLTIQQRNMSEGGSLAGWIWLFENVLTISPEMKQRTIIYSDYVALLKEKVPYESYRGINLISKRNRNNSASEILAYIKEIARMQHI